MVDIVSVALGLLLSLMLIGFGVCAFLAGMPLHGAILCILGAILGIFFIGARN